MSKRIEYPQWAERYRTKGHTIRKVRDGYGLYRCTSVYVKGSHPKSVQEYLGMITEKDGFIPKRTASTNPAFVEFGLSRLILANFKRTLERSSFNNSAQDDVIVLGIIHFMFGSVKPHFIKATYLSQGRSDKLIRRAATLNESRIKAISTKVGKLLERAIVDKDEQRDLTALMFLCVIDPANPAAKPRIPDEAREIIERSGLKHG
ncbi:MAG: hypothetical protein LBD12_07555 [Clostridiales Family XIII bacterium]|jgi:hypothetical protein|nr:hypothetical protein [Clostridiales Family XIII bacterium]